MTAIFSHCRSGNGSHKITSRFRKGNYSPSFTMLILEQGLSQLISQDCFVSMWSHLTLSASGCDHFQTAFYWQADFEKFNFSANIEFLGCYGYPSGCLCHFDKFIRTHADITALPSLTHTHTHRETRMGPFWQFTHTCRHDWTAITHTLSSASPQAETPSWQLPVLRSQEAWRAGGSLRCLGRLQWETAGPAAPLACTLGPKTTFLFPGTSAEETCLPKQVRHGPQKPLRSNYRASKKQT